MSKKMIIIIGAAALIFLLIIGAGFFVVMNKMASIQNQGVEKVAEEEEEEEEVVIGAVYSINTFLVNLADQGGKRYLRVKIDLEISDENLKEELDQRMPQIKDSILMILPAKKFDDIKDREGKTALRNEIIKKLNSFLTTGTITYAYFTEFVVQ